MLCALTFVELQAGRKRLGRACSTSRPGRSRFLCHTTQNLPCFGIGRFCFRCFLAAQKQITEPPQRTSQGGFRSSLAQRLHQLALNSFSLLQLSLMLQGNAEALPLELHSFL